MPAHSSRKATHQQTRLHNSRLVLKTIYDHGRISRAEIARITGLTRPTVSDMVAELMEEGLVEEVGQGPSEGGKPPILLSVVDDARHLIGIDLASDAFRGAVINLRGETRHRVHLPLHGQDGEAALQLVYRLIDELASATDRPLLGIGIGTPGLMDPVNGVVRQAVNLDWQDLPLRRLLEERYALPIYVANDCQVAALAEYTFGKGKDVDNLVLIKIEHGIGAGIVLNGQLFYGSTFGAGEIGHVAVVEEGERCRCGNFGCLETVASARAILQRARRAAQTTTIADVCRAFQNGDERVRQPVLEAAKYLGVAAANLVGALSVRRILIAGSVTCFGEGWLEAIRQEMLRRSLGAVACQTEVGFSAIDPDDIVILGASALVLTYELGLFAPLAGGIGATIAETTSGGVTP